MGKGHKYTLKNIDAMSPLQMQREKEFHLHREALFPELTFTYPEVDARVYDVIINERYKVQDKVISCYPRKTRDVSREKKCKPSQLIYSVRLCKTNTMKYCYGHNDMYWLSLPDKRGAYVIPQQCLFEKNLIVGEGENTKMTSNVTLHPYTNGQDNYKFGWLNEHLYLFENKEDMDKIVHLFDDYSRSTIKDESNHFEIFGNNRFNSLDKRFVNDMVKVIFKKLVV
jgi:hypothetical protein